MPAMLDDPSSPAIYRTSGQPPFPEPYGELSPDIMPRQVTLRDRVTTATLLPFNSPSQVPHHLTKHLCDVLNREIEKGDTYPMMEPMALSYFAPYWFSNFAAIMILGDIQSAAEVSYMDEQGADWSKECLGAFYIKPNYPGRSSHVCNGGFLVTDAARNRGVGRLMGEGYLEWAPKLGYTYSVFNLVYETNVASLRIWDALGFKRIGRVKGCGNLKSYPDQYIDAIIFGRELGGDGDDYVSEERFDKIRFYLKTGTYPNGSDRAEKSRLRSAATHYRLIPNTSGDGDEEKLMLKGKEVISDPHKQYEIARNMHVVSHGGINKTTASIAEKYHWVRIKETVSAAIRNCPDCKDSTAGTKPTQSPYTPSVSARRGLTSQSSTPVGSRTGRSTVTAGADDLDLNSSHQPPPFNAPSQPSSHQQRAPIAPMTAADSAGLTYEGGGNGNNSRVPTETPDYDETPVDPQIMQGIQHHPGPQSHHHAHHQSQQNPDWSVYQPPNTSTTVRNNSNGGRPTDTVPGASNPSLHHDTPSAQAIGGPETERGNNSGDAEAVNHNNSSSHEPDETVHADPSHDVDARLREELEAQMMTDDHEAALYTRALRERGR